MAEHEWVTGSLKQLFHKIIKNTDATGKLSLNKKKHGWGGLEGGPPQWLAPTMVINGVVTH